jgi:hypothetical protein
MRGQTAGEHLGRVCGGGTTGGGALENGGAADRKGTEMITPYFPRTQTGKDTLVWKLTPSGVCSSKSAYKHCFNNLALPANQRPKVVPPHIVNLLNQVWQEKQMAPRVQTFAWRLLRRALPIGKRASKFSKHIKEDCSRCGGVEDEMHMLFLCAFSKAAWFSAPWFIQTEILAENHRSVSQMIQALLSSGHPHINISTLYTFLWCLWKARNDALFNKRNTNPLQVYHATNAILQGLKLEDNDFIQGSRRVVLMEQGLEPQRDPFSLAGNIICCDAAWKNADNQEPTPAGIGIVIQIQNNQHCQQIHLAALSPAAHSPLQAEAFGLLLAAKVADLLHIEEPQFFTDCSTLEAATKATSVLNAPGHWVIRPILADIQATYAFHPSRVAHITRCFNFKAHHQARLGLRLQSTSLAFRCLSSSKTQCFCRDVLSMASVNPFTLLSVKCC